MAHLFRKCPAMRLWAAGEACESHVCEGYLEVQPTVLLKGVIFLCTGVALSLRPRTRIKTAAMLSVLGLWYTRLHYAICRQDLQDGFAALSFPASCSVQYPKFDGLAMCRCPARSSQSAAKDTLLTHAPMTMSALSGKHHCLGPQGAA